MSKGLSKKDAELMIQQLKKQKQEIERLESLVEKLREALEIIAWGSSKNIPEREIAKEALFKLKEVTKK